MSPGELATVLALIRARLEDGDIADTGSVAHYTFLPSETWARSQTVWALQRHCYYPTPGSYYAVPLRTRLRAIDMAIAEAEANYENTEFRNSHTDTHRAGGCDE